MTATTLHSPTERRRRRPLRAAGALIEATTVLAGIPALLVFGVGWPLPHVMPTWEQIQTAYQLRYMPDRLVLGALACLLWLWWAAMLISLAGNLIARARATEFRRPSLLPSVCNRLAGRWVSAGALIVTLGRPAGAAPAPACSLIAVSRAIDTPTTNVPLPKAVTTIRSVTTAPTTTAANAVPTTPPPTRTYVTGDHDTYWEVAEATLGDGTRWCEIMDANPQLGAVDLLPAASTLTIPMGHQVTVKGGDNLWDLAAHELRDAHGERPSNAEIVPYWRELIDDNTDQLRSGDPDLIYPGETVTVPFIGGVGGTSESQARDPGTPSAPGSAPVATAPATSKPVAASTATTAGDTTTAHDTSPDDVENEDDEPFELPWIPGLAIGGVAAAGILAAWRAQRRQRGREYRDGDPIPTLTEDERDLISQLRGIAETERHSATDQAMRLLAAVTPATEAIPGVTVARAGRYAVELLLDNAASPTPKHFIRLDQHTIVVNPGLADETISELINDCACPAPAMVVLGTDDVGSVLVDLERAQALAIESETPEESDAVIAALLTELATQTWASSTHIHTLGIDATIDPEHRITRHTVAESLITAAEAHLQSQIDAVIAGGTHAMRVRTNMSLPVAVAIVGHGYGAAAAALAAAARQQGTALAVISAEPLPNSAWRLVIVDGTATLEPAGMTVANRRFTPGRLDREATSRLQDVFAKTAVPERPAVPEIGASAAEAGEADSQRSADDEIERVTDQPAHVAPGQDGSREEADPNPLPDESLGAVLGFDQLVLLREQEGEHLEPGLSVDEAIAHIIQGKPVELVLLDGPPRLEGVQWDPKKAPRADEIVTFIMLNGPTTLRQLALALWPDKPRPDNTATQTISRTRSLLGNASDGRPRLSVGNRATPFTIHCVDSEFVSCFRVGIPKGCGVCASLSLGGFHAVEGASSSPPVISGGEVAGVSRSDLTRAVAGRRGPQVGRGCVNDHWCASHGQGCGDGGVRLDAPWPAGWPRFRAGDGEGRECSTVGSDQRACDRVVAGAGKTALGLNPVLEVPARVDGATKAALLALVDDATAQGWSIEKAGSVLGVDVRRLQRWRLRAGGGGLDDAKPGGGPLHAILDSEERAVLDIIERWGPIDRSHRKLAHRGSYLRKVWVSPSTVRRILERHNLRLPKPYQPRPAPPREWPDAIKWEPNRIWMWDSRQFTRADRHVVVIIDVVSRKWIEHIVTPEFSATQTVVLFSRALQAEGIAEPDELLDTAANHTLDQREPVLLAWSDNGTQMKAETTRQFMALAAIWQHHGRPHTPTDQAQIESFFSHLVYDWPHLDHIDDPVTLSTELARIRIESRYAGDPWVVRAGRSGWLTWSSCRVFSGRLVMAVA